MGAMRTFVALASLSELAPGRSLAVPVAGGTIALFNVGGRIFALEDTCVRCGASLAMGKVEATSVLCSGCDWRYGLATGCVNGVPALHIDTFHVDVVDGNIMVEAALLPQGP